MSVTFTKRGIRATGKGAQALFDAISARLDKPAPQSSQLISKLSPRRVKLQVNQSGAWRDALRFDIDQLADEASFLEAADKMVRSTGQDKTTMRIVTDEAISGRLMYWNAERGWEPDGITPASTA